LDAGRAEKFYSGECAAILPEARTAISANAVAGSRPERQAPASSPLFQGARTNKQAGGDLVKLISDQRISRSSSGGSGSSQMQGGKDDSLGRVQF
jgi:hypothetical protein